MILDLSIKALKVFLGLFILIISILIIGILLSDVDPSNQVEYYDQFTREGQLKEVEYYSVDSLRSFHRGKLAIEKYETATLIALSRYPELRDVNISIELTDSGAPLESSFKYLSLLKSAKNRKYVIYLFEASDPLFEPILVKNLPFDAQVGIIAHELGHTAYYLNLNFFQILKWAVLYSVDPEFRATHERTTDLQPVSRGLGNQIYSYAEYVRTSPETVELYKMGQSFIDKFYLTHHEIRTEMDKMGYQ